MAAHYKRHHRKRQKQPMAQHRAAMDQIQKRKCRTKKERKSNVKISCFGIIPFKRWSTAHWNRWNCYEHMAKSKIFLHNIFLQKWQKINQCYPVCFFLCSPNRTLENKLAITIIIAAIAVLSTLYHIPGNHQALITAIRANLWFVVYWVGLGVLSSVGLGTGLHTFLLYLGPHIASVTLAAYECNSLNFPSPPYPDE